MKKIKFLQVINSSNFKVSIISLILLVFSLNGVDLGTADQLYEMFSVKGSELITTIILFLINSGSKIYTLFATGKFSWDFLKSNNFQVALLSIFSILLSAYFNEVTVGIIISILLSVINVLIHLKDPAKYPIGVISPAKTL